MYESSEYARINNTRKLNQIKSKTKQTKNSNSHFQPGFNLAFLPSLSLGCFLSKYLLLILDDYFELKVDDKCLCHPPCRKVSYKIAVSYADAPNSQVAEEFFNTHFEHPNATTEWLR